jgi:hypothetical protein
MLSWNYFIFPKGKEEKERKKCFSHNLLHSKPNEGALPRTVDHTRAFQATRANASSSIFANGRLQSG